MIISTNNKPRSIHNNQDGLVSIIVVVVLMLMISIITLSFAKVVRNEQRQALDRQLNTQASYAAESGINYANKIIDDEIKTGTPITQLVKDKCGPDGTSNGDNTASDYTDKLQLETGVSVSCLLVQTNPRTLVYDLDTTQQSKIFPVKPVGPTTRVLVEWTPQTGNTNTCPNSSSAANTLPAATAWQCPYALLRVDLTRTNMNGSVSRRGLAENTYSGVFMPSTLGLGSNGAGSTNFAGKNAFGGSAAAQGERSLSSCNATKCQMYITLPVTDGQYHMRVSPLYRSTKVTISALNVATPVGLSDAQLVIDATGKAQDILRRLQVRIPLVNDGIHADYGIQSKESICKAFTAFPGRNNSGTSCN